MVNVFKATIEPALRAEYDYPGSWSLQFVKTLCDSTDPESRARRVFATIREIQAVYPRANPKSIERWARGSVISQGKKRASIQELLKDVPNITVNEQELSHAASDLDKLREALLSGHIKPMSNAKLPVVQRLLRITDANWDRVFDELDISKEARRIYFAVRDYNATLNAQEIDHAIRIEPEYLYILLLKFANDVEALKEEGRSWAASSVARFHAPGIYVFYRKKYRDVLPAGLIDETVSHWPMTIDAHIEQRVASIQALTTEFGTSLTPPQIHRFSYHKNSGDRVRAYLAFAPQAQAAHPWITPHDLARIFYRSAAPEADFEVWAQKVEAIKTLHPKDPRFPAFICKIIARRDGNAADIIATHLARIKEILDEYKGNPFITLEFAVQWAANSPENYKKLSDYLARVEEVERLLDECGEEIDYIALRYIAFSGSKPKKRVEKYLELKYALEAAYPEDDCVEQWMVNQAAAFSNSIGFARAKLAALRRMKREGVFDIYLDSSSCGDRPLRDTEDKAWQSLPENVVIHLESYAEQQAQIETYLSNLNTLDRLAVESVFGFTTGVDVTELQEELGVNSLEDYVMNEVIPYLKLQGNE